MTSQTVTMSNVQNIDGLLSGVRWAGTVMTYGFPTAAADYGDYAHNVDHDNNPSTPAVSVDETDGFSALNAQQQAAVQAAFAEFRDLTLMSALQQEPAGGADVRLAMSTTREPGSTTAYAQYPGNDALAGDAWFNTTDYNTPRLGTYAYQTFFHEIGHALGLKHGHEADNGNNTVLSSDRDSLEFSTMTYRAYVGHSGSGGYGVTDGHYPQSYMMLDIAALQYMYGADFATRAGDTAYRFDPATGQMFVNGTGQGVPQNSGGMNVNVLFRTVWDGNGNDTYDFSAYDASRQLAVDLAPGGWTDVDSDSNFQAADLRASNPGTQMARGQVFNALLFNGDTRSLIENAIGGAGADTIRGNQAGNRLEGRAGNDTLEGFDGNDVLDQGFGGGGAYGGNGDDTIWAGDGADTIDGGAGFDLVNYSRSNSAILIQQPNPLDPSSGKVIGGWATGDTMVGIEHVIGSAFDDSIQLGGDGNSIIGGDGNDLIDGAGGRDTLWGDAGNDTLRGGAEADQLHGGTGWDIVRFGSAVTINLATGAHSGEAAGDTFFGIEQYIGSTGDDTMVANDAGAAYFVGGEGVDSLYGGARDDWLQGGKGADALNGGGGSDTASYADAPGAIIAEMYFSDGSTTDGKIHAGEWGYDTLVSIENVEGSRFDDSLYGDERSNTLWGMDGNDQLEGDAGGSPQGSHDFLLGGAGNDVVTIGIFDHAFGGADIDTASFIGGPVFIDYNSNTFQIGGLGFELYEFEIYNGTGGADTLYGASHGETVNFGAGNDVVYGQGGDDFIYVDAGADIMDGGAGRDTMVFGRAMVADWQAGVLDADIGSDSWLNWEAIQGSAGDDRIRTNSWGYAVELRGGAGNDVLATGVTGVVSDTLLGEDGNDQLNGGAGADIMRGGAGNDTYVVDTAADVVDESAAGSGGIDTVQAAVSFSLAASTTLLGQVENLVLLGSANINGTGNASANNLTGNSGANLLQGLGGNDVLNGGAGADTMRGGGGDDIYVVDTAADIVDESAAGSGGIDTVQAALSFSLLVSARLLGQIENLVLLGGGAINGTGNASANNLAGNAGANTLQGLAGNDVLRGGAGADRLDGGAGIDTASYYAGTAGVAVNLATGLGSGGEAQGDTLVGIENLSGSQGNDSLIGNAGANVLQGWNGADVLRGGAGADRLDGGAGVDTASYYTDTAGVGVNLATGLGSGGEAQGDTLVGIENLSGSQGNDSLIGNAGANVLQGWNGADVLRGGAGADRLDGGAGVDTASYYTDTAGVGVNLATGLGSGGEAQGDTLIGIENLSGSQGNDSLVGSAGTNLLQGWNGADVLRGGAGADRMDGGAGIDTASYYTGTAGVTVNLATGLGSGGEAQGDTLAGIENLSGSQGNDSLVGSTGANVLQGWNGNDVLTGAGGKDTLTGGAGADRFVYGSTAQSPIGSGADRITDFSRAQGDRIDLSGIDANAAVAGNQAFSFIGSGAYTRHAGELRYGVSNGTTTVAGDVNGDGASDFHIVLSSIIALVSTDFVL
ncbi:M10 family metallopeptidase C-terminal domain-containing protein [Inquilinus limosus]|uniref:M10 family metallopeptidase C-terminal domain-containing protein n=1 Tax=Inquilinus limosus TaxID=171674 RepID=UPI003F14F639